VSEDPNKGPIYSVALPEDLPIRNGWTQAVPRRDELELVRKRVGDRTVGALEVALATIKAMSDDLLKIHAENASAIEALLKRSGYVLTACPRCGQWVISIPGQARWCQGQACESMKGGT
jgi:hypothetical protein